LDERRSIRWRAEKALHPSPAARFGWNGITRQAGKHAGHFTLAYELTVFVHKAHITACNRCGRVIRIKTKRSGTLDTRLATWILKRLEFDELIENANAGITATFKSGGICHGDGNEQSVVNWLNTQLLPALEASIFGDNAATFEDLQGMFFDDYRRRSRGAYRILYETDRNTFKIEFGKFIEERREQRPHEYIQRLLDHVVRVRKNLPCLIFDNADHFTIEFQEKVYQYARSLYENQLCLIILPITDRTSWQLSKQGALCVASFVDTTGAQN
jgi:hypothetical protein